MSCQIKSRFVGNVFEVAMAVVLKKNVALIDGGHVEILAAAVINISEGRANADAILYANTGFAGNILKFPVAQIFPELVPTELIDEIDVVEAVAGHVRDSYPRAVIVMDSHVLVFGVGNRVVAECDSALLQLIGEMKLVKYFELAG